MVLSGFIFTWGAIGKQLSYPQFIYNRVLRIYPLYLTLIFVALAAKPKAYDLHALIAMLLPFSDFQTLKTGSMTAMVWAIGVEFQFYLLFPLLFKLSEKSPYRTIMLWIAALIILRLIIVLLGGNARDLAYWHLAGRLDQFLLGMLAAYWLKYQSPSKVKCFRYFLASLPLSLLMLTLYHGLGAWPSAGLWKVFWSTFEGGMWALFIAGLVGAQTTGQSIPAKAVAWIGVRSFSIYLLHFPIIQIFCMHPNWIYRYTGHWREDTLVFTTLIILPVVILISSLTWHAIEKPFLNLRLKYLK